MFYHINVNPGLINHGLLIRGYSSNSHNLILKWYPPIKQPKGLLIQGWHYIIWYHRFIDQTVTFPWYSHDIPRAETKVPADCGPQMPGWVPVQSWRWPENMEVIQFIPAIWSINTVWLYSLLQYLQCMYMSVCVYGHAHIHHHRFNFKDKLGTQFKNHGRQQPCIDIHPEL